MVLLAMALLGGLGFWHGRRMFELGRETERVEAKGRQLARELACRRAARRASAERRSHLWVVR